jgi:hypothetical protein
MRAPVRAKGRSAASTTALDIPPAHSSTTAAAASGPFRCSSRASAFDPLATTRFSLRLDATLRDRTERSLAVRPTIAHMGPAHQTAPRRPQGPSLPLAPSAVLAASPNL